MAAQLLPLKRDEFTGQIVGGKYELLCHLATGGMSELALAFQRGLAGFQKVVVIKRILSHISEDSEFVALFLDEAGGEIACHGVVAESLGPTRVPTPVLENSHPVNSS